MRYGSTCRDHEQDCGYSDYIIQLDNNTVMYSKGRYMQQVANHANHRYKTSTVPVVGTARTSAEI